MISRLLYDLGIFGYRLAIGIAAFRSRKAKQWIAGRKNIFHTISGQLKGNEPRLWIHCASLGEFEQGRPVIERLKNEYPGIRIIVTFFSPSGYEIRKNYAGADHVFYLPADTKANAEKFISLLRPSLVIFVKYEFWYHYLTELERWHIPVLLISAIFRKEQIFFRWYGQLFRRLLTGYDRIFVQTAAAESLLQQAGIAQVTLAGDTRFDQVIAVADRAKAVPVLERFLQGGKALMAGSTWPDDEKMLAGYYRQQKPAFPLVIAPHEIHEDHIRDIERLFEGMTVRYSRYGNETISDKPVLIIDNIGMLSSLYRYGFAAYIGGGFNAGIHNVLEAAVFGIPVIFGPRYQAFNEAVMLVDKGGAFTVGNTEDLAMRLLQLTDQDHLRKASAIAGEYVRHHAGATVRITDYIQEKRFLTVA